MSKADEFARANVTGRTYQSPSTTTSIEKIRDGSGGIDCSAFIDEIFKQSGFKAPRDYKGTNSTGVRLGNKGSWSNGVALVVDGLPVVNKNDLSRGDIVTFRSSRSDHQGTDGEFDHIGIIKKVEKKNGEVIGFTYYDSGGSNSTAAKEKAKNPNTNYKAGPRKSTYSFIGDPCSKCNQYRGAYRPAFQR